MAGKTIIGKFFFIAIIKKKCPRCQTSGSTDTDE